MRAWIVALPRPDLERCIELGCFGKEQAAFRIIEVAEGDGVVFYALKESRIVALGKVVRGYYRDETPKFLKEGVFPNRFDFAAKMLDDKELDVRNLSSRLTSIPEGGNFGLLVKGGFRELNIEDWNLICGEAGVAEMSMLDNSPKPKAGPKWWWVNQGQTFDQERQGGYIWAPQRAKNGQQIFHHQNVSKVRRDDVILHYVDGSIVSISVALKDAAVSPKPAELPSELWATEGYIVPVKYFDLEPAVKRDSIPVELRKLSSREAKSPFNKDGQVNQGYLFSLSEEFVKDIISQFPQLVPPNMELVNSIDQLSSNSSLDNSGGPFDYQQAVADLIKAIGKTGMSFEPWQIACYVAAIRTKPFLILAGVSGSGKSQLPQLVAEATSGHSELIPVRPDWTDSSDILGYVQLQGRLRPGPLLQLADTASRVRNKQYVCIVDEMNLARVEHYFAEILSRIEEGRSNGGTSGRLLTQSLAAEDKQWSNVALPNNLALVGTVNMDESTHGFSKKVLDRAFTLEFSEIDLSNWEQEVHAKPMKVNWPSYAWQPRATRLPALKNLSDIERNQIRSIVATLIEINQILHQAQLQLAYRSRDEIVFFVLHAQEMLDSFVTTNGDKVDPLDLALQMKVLPRIAGGSGPIRKLILQLLGWSWSGTSFQNEDAAEDVLSEWTKANKPHSLPGADFPRTCARLCLMWERILHEGYTSFWL